MIRKEDDVIDSMQYALRALGGRYNEQSDKHKHSTIIDAEYTVIEGTTKTEPLTQDQYIDLQARRLSETTPYSFETWRDHLRRDLLKQLPDFIDAIDLGKALNSMQDFLNPYYEDDKDDNGSRHKWYYGLERQRRHPCPTNQKRPQKKHHT